MSAVDVASSISFAAFFLLLTVGTISTLSRVAYYKAHGFRRPRLLVRDANMIAGFSVSFGLILAVRVFRAYGFDVSGLATSLAWVVGSSAPAIWAVLVYAYFEAFVIERGGDQVRDDSYLNPMRPHDEREGDA